MQSIARSTVLALLGVAAGWMCGSEENGVARYPIAVLRQAADTSGAATFVELVLSHSGRQILAGFGFGAP